MDFSLAYRFLLFMVEGCTPAAPYKSDDADAAVEDALGTLSVAVSAMKIAESGRPSAVAAI